MRGVTSSPIHSEIGSKERERERGTYMKKLVDKKYSKSLGPKNHQEKTRKKRQTKKKKKGEEDDEGGRRRKKKEEGGRRKKKKEATITTAGTDAGPMHMQMKIHMQMRIHRCRSTCRFKCHRPRPLKDQGH